MKCDCNCFKQATSPAALRAVGVWLALTLYICNIYPRCSFAQEQYPGDWLEIEQVFDFAVPVEVVAEGVSSGISNLFPQNSTLATDLQDYADPQYNEHLFALADEVSARDMRKRILASYGLNSLSTTVYSADADTNLFQGEFGAGGLTREAIGFALGDVASDELFSDGDVPFFAVPSLDGLSDSLEEPDSLPADSPFQTANPLIQGLGPSPSWFAQSLTAGALYEAVFQPFNSEILAMNNFVWLGSRPFAYLHDTILEVCDNLQVVISDPRVLPRRIVCIPLALMNILLIFKWWLWRLTRIWAIITGTENAPVGDDASK